MSTTHKGGAIRKLSAQRGYAGGGLLDTLKSAVGMQTSKQVMDAKVAAEMRRREGQQPEPTPAPATASAAPPASAPTNIFNRTLQRREAEAGLAQGGAIKGPAGAIRQRAMTMAQKKSPEGAKLKGPGTPTSDDIPAVVVDTGEPINVATEERIASKKQNVALEREAKTQGYENLDAKLEDMTGHPVGPTIKYKGGAGAVRPIKNAHLMGVMEKEKERGVNGAKSFAEGGLMGVIEKEVSNYIKGTPSFSFGGVMGVIEKEEERGFRGIPSFSDGGLMGVIEKAPELGFRGISSFAAGGEVKDEKTKAAIEAAYEMGRRSAGPVDQIPTGGAPDGDGDAVDRVNALASRVQSGGDALPSLAQIGAASAPRNIPVAPTTRDDLVAQIPTGGAQGADPTPATDAVRTGAIRKLATAQGADAGSPVAQLAPAPTSSAVVTQAPTTAGGAVRPATPLASPGSQVTLMGATGKNVGYGATRFDVPGKSPLFTDTTDGEGMASNAALINRGSVSGQNLGALAGIQKRQDIGDLARAQKAQYDAEVAGAAKINGAPAPYDPEAGARAITDMRSPTSRAIANLSARDKNGNLAPGAEKLLAEIYKQALGDPRELQMSDQNNRADMARTEVLREGNHLAAGATRYAADSSADVQRARNANEQGKQMREEHKANAELQQKARIDHLDNLIINGNPLQQKMAANQKAALMGKGMESGEGKPLNDTQSKALLFGSRMQRANEILDKLAQSDKYFSTPGANGIAGGLVNLVNSKEGQQLDQAKRDFINATLRRESGAVISDPEFDNGNKQYFPQIGDAPEVIEQKRQNRLLAQQAILAEVPNSEARVSQVRSPQGQGQSASINQPAQPTDAAAYAALPSGATYMTPSGELRRKK